MKHITKFTQESGFPGQLFIFLKVIASGLKGVPINFVMCFIFMVNL